MREKIKNSTYTHKKNRIIYVNRSENITSFSRKNHTETLNDRGNDYQGFKYGISGFRMALAFY